jgi:hypothetical protein
VPDISTKNIFEKKNIFDGDEPDST